MSKSCLFAGTSDPSGPGCVISVMTIHLPDVPGGPQDHEEERAIESYAQFKADAYKTHQVSSHGMTTKEGSNYPPRERRRGLLRRLKLIHPL
jgi:hypothetical protein